ncbi:protein SOSEKI 5-like [Cicer arietinum]|uniref:Uncharacterized protein LOC101493418 n=1 Tax=Cicer arietinum TaxID=3827 RepID=A0A1S2Y095_CICAR|nr:uncharacterized protein LOC101493418 [Cicer arietinum]XP_012570264.1 uncharacterized protein LOC101493418 [Cicer arietinum]XP_027189782.1 uncharacterized protein LOC101493418 [Cicer arietinum]
MERKKLESEASHVENSTELKVPVIYYLCRNGQLEHPHLMHVSISSPHGTLCLRDVINRLSFLRGEGIANMYSWSTKRRYRNGFVWQDLSENDLIYPSNSNEYVLKGTQLIEPSSCFRSYETISMPSSKNSNETNSSSMDADSPSTMKCSRHDYKLYKAMTCREFAAKAADASTQTEEKGRQRMEMEQAEGLEGNATRKFSETENGRSLSLEYYGSADIRNQKIENERPSGRMRATEVLMQFVMCRIGSTREDL